MNKFQKLMLGALAVLPILAATAPAQARPYHGHRHVVVHRTIVRPHTRVLLGGGGGGLVVRVGHPVHHWHGWRDRYGRWHRSYY